MKRPMQGRFGFGGYPYNRHWIHRLMWKALSHLIGWSSYIIGNDRAGLVDVWRVEGDVSLFDALFHPKKVFGR